MTLLKTNDVRKHFGGVQALAGVTLDVEAGRITALIGPNGAGKTTFFNALTGFAEIDKGTIEFDGRRVDGLAPWRIARLGMGRTFQTPTGFPHLTVLDNLLVAASRREAESFVRALAGRRTWRNHERQALDRVETVIAQLQIDHVRDTVLSEVSAGEAKLVELGRQLVRDTRLLLLDEPAAGVDGSQLEVLVARMRDLRDTDVTILLVDHNLSFVLEVADRIHVLALGRVIASGAPQEIVNHPEVIEVYIGASHGVA